MRKELSTYIGGIPDAEIYFTFLLMQQAVHQQATALIIITGFKVAADGCITADH